ncbi:hypothetical protein NY99_09065 [Xanthomonas phaseoli pv. phaseoli]|uniref:hypothetical protein n=1 Tax=Xanthomonas TaxID=338 RepID=UPI000537B5DB|nr:MULTISPECIES: hypothetical protein [Xanthomonas]KGU56221.1 hypothetical protein NY99_09065 [Xanthomonas phaseoli pv. phaseoli]KHF48627.1 hypothetical protein QQ30_10000 [Xanthomonas phaseoli pv. phaseoli]KHS08182.1 hypothetical protein RM61_06335 [Xanthomonas phaseoli pv. phaseoli]KHS30904.1 hypothetical protein RM60_08520 [Xanthomonas phaseoli pv. phaseoli]MBD1508533.1 hypothetical protein [Xanthomonas citri pv. citri]
MIEHDASGRKTIAEHETSGAALAKARTRSSRHRRIAAGERAESLAIAWTLRVGHTRRGDPAAPDAKTRSTGATSHTPAPLRALLPTHAPLPQ